VQDDTTTVGQLRQMVRRFVDERDWRQFHDLKNLSMAIATEAAELMEHFRWRTPEEARREALSAEAADEIRDEVADVVCFVLSFANAMELDVASALSSKMAKNESKYPRDRFRGTWKG